MAEVNTAGRWAMAGRALLFLLLSAVMLAAAAPLMMRYAGMRGVIAVGAVTSSGTYLLTMLFVKWERVTLREVGARLQAGSARRLATGFGIGLGLVVVQEIIVAAVCGERWELAGMAAWRSTGVALVMYLLLACREELAFHGYVLQRLRKYFGMWSALITVAVMFAGEHRLGGYSWANAMLGAFVGAMLFGMAAVASRGLAVPIGIHMAYNFGHWLIGGKGTGGVWQPVNAGNSARVELAAYVVVFAAAMAVIGWRRKTELSETR